MLHFDPQEFRDKFNRNHFTVTHDLANHSQFSVSRLIELATETAEGRPEDVYFDVGKVEIGQRWEEIPKGSLSVDETIRRIETQGAWIILRRADLHPSYATLLAAVMSDVLEMTGAEIDRRIKRKEVILFITSPNRVTTYHIDRECNFLLQISGTKEISIFSRDDRDVLPEIEIERFWTVDNNAPVYRPDLQTRAFVFMLEPGNGVHIPVNAPHWLKNGNNVSVSASFNFMFHDSVRADLYRANYYLRRLGLDPRPPFVSHKADAIRRPLGSLANKVRRLYRSPGPHE